MDALRRRAYADLFIAVWGRWEEDRHRRQFAASMERGHIFIIEVDRKRVGMIQLPESPDAVEVAELQIDPAHQGRGIGTAVLREVISKAGGRGLDVRLSVGRKNEGAIRLYERLGFETVGYTDTHCLMRHPAGR